MYPYRVECLPQENLAKLLAQNPDTVEQALELMASLQKRDRAAERRQLHGTASKPLLAAQVGR